MTGGMPAGKILRQRNQATVGQRVMRFAAQTRPPDHRSKAEEETQSSGINRVQKIFQSLDFWRQGAA